MTAHHLLDTLIAAVRSNLPAGITAAYLDGFVARNRPALNAILDETVGRRTTTADPPTTAAARTSANLAAMALAADPPAKLTAAHKRVLSAYTGWGGLSLRRVADRFPAGFPAPDPAGLVHEYYTPVSVANAVIDAIEPLLASLRRDGRALAALEPSAGIGRFVNAADRPTFADVTWHVVERSPLSARMLKAVRPELAVFEGPFERWVADHAHLAGSIDLVIANPPYGPRGSSITDDPDRRYRDKQAWVYFLRRALDLLAPGGLGVFLVPSGFLTGRSAALRALREDVLRRHHLATAFRLPSDLFPGALLVTDLLFFRARGGTLLKVDASDRALIDGGYYVENPEHILGTEVGRDAGETDQTKRPRWGYQVVGAFTGLPAWVERPICGDCGIAPPAARVTRPAAAVVAGEVPSGAGTLGGRVDAYLAKLGADDPVVAALWPELHADLLAWTASRGNPHLDTELRREARRDPNVARLLGAFQRSGDLIPAFASAPTLQVRAKVRPGDVPGLAEALWRAERKLTLHRLLAAHHENGGRLATLEAVLAALPPDDWAIDGDAVLPMRDYLVGHLWPRVDRAREGSERARAQIPRLLAAIAPAVFDDIEGTSPRQGWVPLNLIEGWLSEVVNEHYGAVRIERRDGLVQLPGVDYDELDEAVLAPTTRWCIGWMNHDRTVFKPRKRRDEDLDAVRLALGETWDRSFRDWVARSPERRTSIEDAYNRAFRGWVAPTFSDEPLEIARWNHDAVELHPHQRSAARRIVANRGGLLAFDVGVGKTYTGLAVLARARQEGWSRRPVVLVPNSIAWKWEADVRRVLPDYRVEVIGSRREVVQRGPRKGTVTSVTDTPAERAAKWTRLQAGEVDVVLLTYAALARTPLHTDAVKRYAERTEAIQREVRLRQRNASRTGKLTERQEAVLAEGVGAWVAEMLELPPDWKPDPGVHWDDLGIDLLIVDEAQNFKNLHMPEPREGGVPRFMGNAGEGSKRAWQLDFRAAAVRERTGGAGVVLLSATPAKNSPLEFYNLIQYVDHDVWARQGIRDPEQFIDRYLRIELKPVVDTKMEVVERSAVTGFQNLHELRDTLFRYAEFKTAEDVGLILPEPTVEVVEVDLSPAQASKYDRYVAEIEAALASSSLAAKSSILGLLARMSLVAIHDRLDEGWTWKSAGSVAEPASPKFTALARRVRRNTSCGHIVFVDNIAAHRWVKAVLEEAGVDGERIAVLNAQTATASADRQRIALEFNGTDDEAPRYDVVIANAIAYEGIDLQRRTCAIHHLDLPWEPATLQQRNGRGVRQGNTLSAIAITYYFARRSMDGLRFDLIQGKRGWMTELLTSQDRVTNNPGAQMELGPEEILLLLSRDPAKTAARLAEVKARREAEARLRVARDAARLLRSANARFRKAERSEPDEAERLRAEGESRLRDLDRVDPSAWPWARWVDATRTTDVLVPLDGQAPVWEGLRIAVTNPLSGALEHAELGRVVESTIGLRVFGSARWERRTLDEITALNLTPEGMDVRTKDLPDRETVERAVDRWLGYTGDWTRLGWRHASDAWLAAAWAVGGDLVVERLARATGWYAREQAVPVVVEGRLRVATGAFITEGRVLAPDRAGWDELIERAPTSGLTFTELQRVATWWWDRRMPRGGARLAEAA